MKLRLTAERLRELLDYAPGTGLFYWRQRRGSASAGREAGTWQTLGYRVIQIDQVPHYAHRLAWLHVYGEHPIEEIDHVNRDRTDNRIANLRQCSRWENARNISTCSASGFRGVYRSSTRSLRWRAKIAVNGGSIHLGFYDTAEEAAAAYDSAARLHHQEFASPNANRAKERP